MDISFVTPTTVYTECRLRRRKIWKVHHLRGNISDIQLTAVVNERFFAMVVNERFFAMENHFLSLKNNFLSQVCLLLEVSTVIGTQFATTSSTLTIA